MFYTCWEFGWPDREADEVASMILAAAITLQDSTRRGREAALHPMPVAWKFARRVKVGGQWETGPSQHPDGKGLPDRAEKN